MVIKMTEKQFSLTGFDILVIIALANEGKHLILIEDNKYKVSDV